MQPSVFCPPLMDWSSTDLPIPFLNLFTPLPPPELPVAMHCVPIMSCGHTVVLVLGVAALVSCLLPPSSCCWCFHTFLSHPTSAVFSNLKSPPYTKTINTSEDVGCRDSSCPSSHPASSFLWWEAQNCLQKSVWYNCSIPQHRPLDIFFWFSSYSTQLSASRCAWVLNWGFRQLSWFDFADRKITNLDPVFMYAQHMRNTLHWSVLDGTEMPLGVLSLKHFLLQDHCHIFTASVCMWNTWSRHQ